MMPTDYRDRKHQEYSRADKSAQISNTARGLYFERVHRLYGNGTRRSICQMGGGEQTKEKLTGELRESGVDAVDV